MARRDGTLNEGTAAATGMIVAVSGALVIAGWTLDLPLLVRLRPDWAPMMFNTALAFLSLGLALVALRTGRMRIAASLAVVVASIGALSLAQSLFGFDMGIDGLFAATSGRMAPNTAAGFLLFGIGLAARAWMPGHGWSEELAFGTAALVALLGALTVGAYLAGAGEMTGWGAFTPMALHTGVLFIVAGIGQCALARCTLDRGLLGTVVPLAVLAVSLNLWQALEAAEQRQLRTGFENQAEHARDGIVWPLRTKMLLVSRLAERIGERGYLPDQDAWQVEAAGILRDYTGLGGFGVVDRDGDIVAVVSQAGPGEQVGMNVEESTVAHELFERTRQAGTLQVSQATPLRTGGQGMFMAAPIRIDGVFAGATLATVNFEQLFGTALRHISPGHALSLLEGDETLYERRVDADEPGDMGWSVTDRIDLPGTTWTVRVMPGTGRMSDMTTALPELVFFAGVVTAVLLRLVMHTGERIRRNALRQEALAGVSRELVSSGSLPDILQRLADDAREIIGAHQAVISLTAGSDWSQGINAVSLSDRYAQWRGYDTQPDGSGIYAMVCETNRPARMTQAALEAHPRWRGFGAHAGEHPPMHGWLAVPLVARDGTNLGLIQLSDRYEGEFTENDERIMVQLAALASAVIQNAQLIEGLAQQVAERTRDLEQTNAELEAFNYSVSHDLRTPLRAVSGFGEILSEEYTSVLDEQGRHYLERIMDGTRRMGRLIDDLLSLARVSHSDMRVSDVDLAGLAHSVMSVLREADPERQVRFEAPASLPARGDSALLRVALDNLLGNAWKFTGKRGAATIELGSRDGAYFVKDDGVGFDMQHAGKLFTLFERLHHDDEFPGTGVGLATVKRIVERHGGRVWCETQPGEGACFMFTLGSERA